MKRIAILLLMLFIGGFGSQSRSEVLGSIGTNINYQLTANGRTFEKSQPFSLRAGYRFNWADIYAEYSYVNSTTASGSVSIALANYEFLGWIRKSFRTGWIIEPFVGAGLGTHYQVVTTQFAQQSSRDAGEFELAAAAASGLIVRLSKNIEVSLEGRASFAQAYTPNPMFGFGGYFSLLF